MQTALKTHNEKGKVQLKEQTLDIKDICGSPYCFHNWLSYCNCLPKTVLMEAVVSWNLRSLFANWSLWSKSTHKPLRITTSTFSKRHTVSNLVQELDAEECRVSVW